MAPSLIPGQQDSSTHKHLGKIIMSEVRVSCEGRTSVIKCYWRHENVKEVQRQFRRHFDRDPPRWSDVPLDVLLGVTVDDQLTWKQHVASTVRSATYKLYMMRRLRSLGTLTDELRGVCLTFILPKLMYASPAWSSSLTHTQQLQLERVQKRACRVIFVPAYTTCDEALTTLSLFRRPDYPPGTERLWRSLEGNLCIIHASDTCFCLTHLAWSEPPDTTTR
ncbi:uncharacterized protein LOC135096624 isoform X4 [Scylla paramamosain]|uniref:uncharacterized protein LOC135096624 isoform X4 n=2 Tax=Scylla paramamosain TaxID=85552 RepID=UPI0030834F12